MTDEELGRMIVKTTEGILGPLWRQSPEWDDIRGEAHLQAWRSCQRVNETQSCSIRTAAQRAIGWAPATWDRRWQRKRLLPWEEEQEGFCDEVIERQAAAELWQRCRAYLPPAHLEVLSLVFWEGLNLRQVATRLQCSPNTIVSRYQAAMKRCRMVLGLLPSPPPRPAPVKKAPKPRPPRQPKPPKPPASHCRHGHLWDEANTVIRADGARYCRECLRENERRYRARRKAQRPPRAAVPLKERVKKKAWRSREENRQYMREYRARGKRA